MLRTFSVSGPPVAKGRPRVTKFGAYTPTKTLNYENLVQFCYLESHKDSELMQGNLHMDIIFYFPIPKSTSKKNRALMKEGKIVHTKKPDIDNCIKSITDALNNIAYKDDGQIYSITAVKYYDEHPRTEICIEEV